MRIPLAGLAIAAGLSLSACATNGLYSGVSLGYGSGYGSYGYGGYGYGDPYRYGSLYGSPYWGWHNSFYYPGTGFYVYDRYRRPYLWSDSQRRFWSERRQVWRQRAGTRERIVQRENWSGFTSAQPARSRPARVERSSRSSVTDRDSTIRSDSRRENRRRIRVVRPDD